MERRWIKICKTYTRLLCITKVGSAIVRTAIGSLMIVIKRDDYNNLLKGASLTGYITYNNEYRVWIFECNNNDILIKWKEQ